MEKYIVNLFQEERDYLLSITTKGKASARKITHAQVLLQADDALGTARDNAEIAEILNVSAKTVSRIRKSFIEDGLEAALNREPHNKFKPRRLSGEQEAHLIALACSEAPEGRARWTLKLLAGKLVELEVIDSVSVTTVYETLKKMNLSLG
jgi:transposase